MNEEQQSYVRGSLSQSVVEFFRDYGVECNSSPNSTSFATVPPASESEMGSIVGLRGANIRGGLVFVAPAAVVAHMLPIPQDRQRADMQLRDWSEEIANQLAGRLNNKLSARAFDFDVGTAISFRGMSVRLSSGPSADAVSVSFTIASERVRVYLDCSFIVDSGLVDDNAVRVLPEGDVILF